MSDELRDYLRMLREETKDWMRISIKRSLRESTVEQMTVWLDKNCTGRYYYDTLDINRYHVEVRFELEEDAVFFRVSWENWDSTR